jgi:hypothetical protein
MQTTILRSIALVVVGNAALGGRDVSGFWPGAALWRHYKHTDFLIARGGDEYIPVAPDPLTWFAKLSAMGCKGLRLHTAPMQQREGIGPQKERMLVGMVGGGPRWLIEAVQPARAEIWEGFDRLGDRNDPEQRIWRGAYLMLGATERQDDTDRDIAGADADVRSALIAIEALARDIPGAPFAETFANAIDTLDGVAPADPSLDFLTLTDLGADERRLLAAAVQGWVFGAMGSWNDVGVSDELSARYEQTSEALFLALQRAAIAVANASYRG